MFVILWEFDVKHECAGLFARAYSASGEWAQLFATDQVFRETRLLRDMAQPLRFLTWTSGTASRTMNIFCVRIVKPTRRWTQGLGTGPLVSVTSVALMRTRRREVRTIEP